MMYDAKYLFCRAVAAATACDPCNDSYGYFLAVVDKNCAKLRNFHEKWVTLHPVNIGLQRTMSWLNDAAYGD
ncbi:hypothetical protein C5O25_02275 [Paramuribaculum intestinale]|uniref:Uncharacterized protein n=1 Tax=Paramuribaculum intestinale TaxID=2094151 RepID=A0A2V1IZP9_9BACT|nr:hypothetical protein C5O25_02275 [Paramuribaculum intestinale]ROT15376.1 hypothetical protein EEL50_04995 [Muribaculaceae bacterium Isolate-105 (HZI)]